jgi:hypothetical protein
MIAMSAFQIKKRGLQTAITARSLEIWDFSSSASCAAGASSKGIWKPSDERASNPTSIAFSGSLLISKTRSDDRLLRTDPRSDHNRKQSRTIFSNMRDIRKRLFNQRTCGSMISFSKNGFREKQMSLEHSFIRYYQHKSNMPSPSFHVLMPK